MSDTLLDYLNQACSIHAHRIAIDYDGNKITYSELNIKSSNLAYCIKSYYEDVMGAPLTKNQLIGVYLNRSSDLIITILAILKLGCTYVPINTDYPEERIKRVFEHANLKLCITEIGLRAWLHSCIRKLNDDTVLIEADDRLFLNAYESIDSDIYKTNSESPVYLIYTSGSTGLPKGVLVGQKSVINLILCQTKLLDICPESRVLNFANCSFDASVWEIFATLCNGATLCVTAEENIIPGETLVDTLNRFRITHVTLPPSILMTTPSDNVKTVKLIISAGEKCNSKVVTKWLKKDRRFFNAYGPTEATVCATITEILDPNDVHIGVALEGTEILILDNNLKKVANGQVGEICIAGIGLALGYFNDPKLTNEKFVKYESDTGKVIYKSGDFAKISSGALEYIGRKDDQIKLRGFRIEPSHIEHFLEQSSNIDRAKVLLKKAQPNDLLIGYCLLKDFNKQIDVSAIKKFLKKHLPYYMIPDVIVDLKEFPIDMNGKIDKNKLLETKIDFEVTKHENTDDIVRDNLLHIWKSVLNIKSISKNDNFFDIGGHSLLITQVILLIKQKINIDITVSEFINSETFDDLYQITKLKHKKTNARVDSSILPTIDLAPDKKNSPFPLTPIQQAYYLGRSGYFELSNISTNIYREFVLKQVDIKKLESALNTLIKRHPMLRSIILNSEEQKIIENVLDYQIKIYDLSGSSESQINNHLKKIREHASTHVLPIDQAPILSISASIFDDRIHLHCLLDALILDGWSFYIFFTEWENIYLGNDSDMNDLELTFRDYVIAEQKVKESDAYVKDKAYWHNRLEKMSYGPELPLKIQPQDVTNQKSKALRTIIDKETWKKITRFIEKHDISKTTLLLSIYAEILHYWSTSKQFVINLTLFNRLPIHPQVNQIIGDFTSLELLQIDYEDTKGISFLKRCKIIQERLYNDLDHRLYTGIEVQRDIAKLNKLGFYSAIAPVVFTCFLQSIEVDENAMKMFNFDNLAFGSTQSSQVWLDYKAYEENEKLIVEWDYIYDLFPENMIEGMHEAYSNVLSELSINDDSWNETSLLKGGKNISNKKYEYFEKSTLPFVHDLIMDRANQQPKQTAIIYKQEVVTYEKLINESCHAANFLQHHGIQTGDIVALHYGRCPQQVYMMLGTIMAGAAYLPIDINLPSKRVYEILSDASPKVLLSQLKYIKKINLDGHIVGENTDIQIVDTDGENYKGCSVVKNIDCLQKPNKLSSSDLAYIIYTSGSSGKPKGVMIQHYALMNTLLDINQRYEVNTSDTVLALSNYSFDLSVYDIFGLLIAGGKIVLIEEEKAIEPQHWLDLIEKNDISIWNSVPALAQMLVSHASVTNKNIEKLRLFLLSGDWIPLQLPDEIRALHQNSHHLKITSLGGATECAIWSILFDIDQKIAQHWKSIPYGYAMKNQSVYILDEHYNICPKWVVGHIYIGGNGLAQGYLNDQEKTNKHFIINPNNNERMYFTGDLGRYIENGLIEFLGRDDCQVKISGYRIELGDVENTLNNHPLIDRTVVDIHQQGKDKSLIAYISGYNHPKNELTNESMFKSEEEIFNFKINTSNIENFKNGLQEYQLAIDGSINFAKHYCKIRPYRRFDIRNFSQFGVNNLLNNLVRKDVNNSLLSVLNHLSSCYSKDKEKFIYLYPSASSLYSIQVYIKIVNSTMSLDLGYYYFNPESKKLQLIKKIENFDLSETTNSIYFVQKKTLIEPIYGKLSYRFGMLEIGHMLACSGLNILKNYDFLEVYSESDLRGRPQLEKLNLSCDDHKLLVDYQLPDHVAASSDIIKSDFNKSSVVIYYKSDNEKNISEGWYRYHSNNSLNRINIEYKLDVSDFIADNQLIFQDSHFVIFLLADFDNYKSSYVNIGYFAHNLQMNAINNNIGLCPVGTVSNKINRFFENSLGQKIIYTLVGGGLCIDKYDIDYCSIPRDDYRLNAVALRNYLIDLLPDYMVPRNYVFIDEVPLTANGKVDRNKLKKLADKSVTNRSNNQKKPSNSLEKLIHKHWEFILDQEVNSIHESFRYYGGNSLGLLRLANVLSSETNVNITITDLMKNDSIIAQASYIGRMNTESYLQLQEEVIVI